MFSTAVYLLEGFLMKQDAIAVLVEYLFEYYIFIQIFNLKYIIIYL